MGDRLKRLRKELDLTQEAFASRIGSVQNTITGYESGRRNPSAPVISLICREFDVNEEWLRNGTGEMFAPESNDELEALAKKYNLSNADQVLIEKYVNLKAGSRETIINFMIDVVAALDGAADQNDKAFPVGDIYAGIPDTPGELERKFPPLENREEKEGGLG
ncbi:XRE family transcriptional regulator [Clostridium sp. OF03-18AA]|nr:XRE family transcriptional regulator [Clostridium sp. OF03-18AA]